MRLRDCMTCDHIKRLSFESWKCDYCKEMKLNLKDCFKLSSHVLKNPVENGCDGYEVEKIGVVDDL